MPSVSACAHLNLDVVTADYQDDQVQAIVECLDCGAQGLDCGGVEPDEDRAFDQYDPDDCDRALTFVDRVCQVCGAIGWFDSAGHPGYCEDHNPDPE